MVQYFLIRRTLLNVFLTQSQQELKEELELQIRTGFVLRGEALATLRRKKLYHDEYETFEEYCTAVFGFTSLYIKRCIKAASTYRKIEKYLQTNGLSDPLPSKQRQLRPIFQAPLNASEVGLVWTLAVTLASGAIPTSSIVTEAVKSYLRSKSPPTNPFNEGQICRIIGGVPGKKNCWCVVSQVKKDECVVDTWNSQYVVAIDDLSPMQMSPIQEEQILDLGERMTALSEVGELDEAAMWLLRGLEKLKRSQLNSLEEKLLQVLEEFYLSDDVV